MDRQAFLDAESEGIQHGLSIRVSHRARLAGGLANTYGISRIIGTDREQ